MAENILGLLLVTSTSRGRAVFRYPPDPASPNIRLAQPIYPSATFTATEFDLNFKNPYLGVNTNLRNRLFGDDGLSNSHGKGKGKSSSSAAVSTSIRRSKLSSSDKRNRKDRIHPMYLETDSTYEDGYSDVNNDDGEEDDASENATSSDEDSDYDVAWSTQQQKSTQQPPQRNTSTDDKDHGLRSIDNSVVIEPSRRGSGSTTAATITDNPHNTHNNHQYDNSNNNHNVNSGNDAKKEREKIDSQYNYALGYHLDFLSDMLTPPRAACNRKFEICVESLVFIGHPVCSGPDGKWEIPNEDDELPPSRGRKMGGTSSGSGRNDSNSQVLAQHSSLGPLVENAKEGNLSSPDSPAQTQMQTKMEDKDDTPSLNMFHLVLIIDKPDPKPGTEAHDEHHNQTLGMYDEVYREIAFKWTAAAWKLQCETNFIAKQSWKMAKYKEKCLAEGIDITDCCRWLYANMPLDRNLNSLYLRLHQLKSQPANPLHSYLPTTITTHLAEMTINTVLSPKVVDADEAWAHWGERDEISESEASDSDDDDWEDPTTAIRRPELRVEPWQTLLLIEDDAAKRADEISTAIIGLGVGMDSQSPMAGERRGSKATVATSQDQEDEAQLMKALIEACDVTKPLVEIAHALRFDLDAIVIPLARELVENKKAILVDVINTRLRTIVMPTTVDEHTVSIEQYTARFSREFPSLAPFSAYISQISSSPAPFRDIIPSDPDLPTRNLYMSALIWLLKQDLVVQVHTRARVYARKEIQVEAWKRLWKRRREKWIRSQEQQRQLQQQQQKQQEEIMKSPTGSDLVTPRANDGMMNPLEATIPPPNQSKIGNGQSLAQSHDNISSSGMDRSYLDYDPALEMDSDEDVEGNTSGFKFQNFKSDVEEPPKSEIPKFESSFIFKPARAQKDESRWLRIIRESADEVTASKFDLVVQYLDGMTTFEEISYRTGLPKRQLDRIMSLYKDDIITFIHP
ncbi:uncharacterized protein IL334_006181 [Kwoniella shivajii]|uniref:Nitrogen permease regulator 3 n=1 Tax=Kwoniella shivajii TaxID=564305 RepID=A0ABZ1D6G9_9TREE|nr:hypothetical protein IL334_006181 [Kwoniella shivajii]